MTTVSLNRRGTGEVWMRQGALQFPYDASVRVTLKDTQSRTATASPEMSVPGRKKRGCPRSTQRNTAKWLGEVLALPLVGLTKS